jgi:nucleoside-diphosphate-sugar epimerase
MKLLIVGGGFTGAAVARSALARGLAVTATTRSDARARSLLALGATPLVSPTLDGRTLAGHVDEDTYVLVTVPPNGVADVSLAASLPRAAAVAYVSSTAVYGGAVGRVDETTPTDRNAPRAAPRLDAEAAWQRAGASVFRAPGIYGPGRGLHLRLARGEVRLAGPGGNAISRVHVEDLAAALLAALEARVKGEVFVVGDAEPAPHAEVVGFLCDALGIPLPAWDRAALPDETLRNDRRVDGSRLRTRFDLALVYRSYREGYANCVALDRAALDEAIAAATTPAFER